MASRAVVIGGGAVGVASAYYLHRSGWHVTIIDRGDIGRGCSYGNACLIVPSHAHPLPEPGIIGRALRWMLRPDSPVYVRPQFAPTFVRWVSLFRRYCAPAAHARGSQALLALARASIALFDDLARIEGLSFFYERRGLLHAYLTDAGVTGVSREEDGLRRAGFEARRLTRDETLALEPALNPRVRGGLLVSGDAHGHSFDFVRALAGDLERRGARVLTHHRVSRVLTHRGRVHSVVAGPETAGAAGRRAAAEEDIPADVVVLAAGAWTPSLAEDLGLDIPMIPAKGYSCTVDAYPGGPSLPIYLKERRVAITPLGPRLRIGGTLELIGFQEGLNRRRYDAVVAGARLALNDAFRLENEEAWFGFRPVLPDGLPIISTVPDVAGLIIAAGHAMLGFTLAPVTGNLVAELADGRAPSAPVEPFRIDRFDPAR